MNVITKIGILNDADLLRQQALIGGVWRDADTKTVVDVINPASLTVLGTVPDLGGDETRAAISVLRPRPSIAGRKGPMPSVQHFWSAGTTSFASTNRIWLFC